MKALAATFVTSALAAAALVAATPAVAQHGHYYGPRVGVYIGAPYPYYRPYWGPGYYYGPGPYYYPPYYAYPAYPAYPPAPAAPPVYVERNDGIPAPAPAVPPAAAPQAPAAQSLEPGYWYYCRNPAGYYPTVRECAGGWERVSPQAENAQPQR